MQRRRLDLCLFSFSVAAAVGCQGHIGAEPDETVSGGGNSEPSTVSVPLDDWPGLPGTISDECMTEALAASEAPLRRLTAQEYENTLRDLFRGLTLPEIDVAEDGRTHGFTNAAAAQASTPLVVEQYAASAAAIARAAVEALAAWAPCAEATADCAETVVVWLAERAYRRPLSEDERTTLSEFVKDAVAQESPLVAIEMGIEALLQSPYFLYRPEYGSNEKVVGDAVRLSGFEAASRLSYFLVGTMPDDALRAAAANGDLLTPAGYRAQAERLLADPRAREVVTDFFVQWLGLYKLDELQLDQSEFPEFSPQLRSDLKASVVRYVEDALWEEDSWAALTTGSYGYVNDRLAPLFGVPEPGSDELVRVELDPSERRGVLTQPGALSSTSHGRRHSPILRGVAIMDGILCLPTGTPPPEAATGEPVEVDPSLICTTRDDVTLKHTSKAGCAACHTSIDGVGFTFEHYDALGRYRSQENGCAIDAEGFPTGGDDSPYFGSTDIEAGMEGALAFAEAMSTSGTATACFVDHMFRYAFGRDVERAGQCEVDAVAEHLLDGNDSLQELILNLVMSPSFLSRPRTP